MEKDAHRWTFDSSWTGANYPGRAGAGGCTAAPMKQIPHATRTEAMRGSLHNAQIRS